MVINIAEDVCIFYLSEEWLGESTDPSSDEVNEWVRRNQKPWRWGTLFAQLSYVYWPIRGLHVVTNSDPLLFFYPITFNNNNEIDSLLFWIYMCTNEELSSAKSLFF